LARPIHIEPHATIEELKELYRKAKDPVLMRRLLVIRLAAEGRSSREIGEVTDYGRDWIFKLVKRFNDDGIDGLVDGRHDNGGHGRVLNDQQLEALRVLLESPPPDGGLWTSPKVAKWMTEQVGRPVDFKLAWDYLKRLDFSLQRPRPSHVQADKEAQEAFKKGGFAVVFETSWHKEEVPRSRSGRKTKRDSGSSQ